MRLDLPSAARNPLSLIGVAIATAMAVLFLALLALELGGELVNPYLGLLLFVAVPAVFLLGLLLIPIGAWFHRRRMARGGSEDWPVIDLRLPRTRSIIFTVGIITCFNILIFSLAAYGAVHHMESAEFCGQTCHTVMEPEYAAYEVSPHSKVGCVACHVGPGAGALMESKIAGTRQLWQLFTKNYPAPVHSPVRTMRPARETCETCHWSEKSHGDKLRQIREYGDDEKSTETVTTLQLHVGGGRVALHSGSGIHWHMNIENKVEFIATDPQRQVIPWVKFTDRTGTVKEYTVEGTTPEQLAKGEYRTMDCMDCHNRPAHTFEPSAERAVDNAITSGLIPHELPFARREAVAALKADYPSRDAAFAGIEAKLLETYRAKTSEAEALARMIAGVQGLYARNVFPAMKVGWGTYPNNIGHVAFQGCFRCHDENHKATDGTAIAQDCQSCHDMP
ncbi:MAG: NapC/NirT family cytochrome c [Acidobacteriota bacterium]|nr:NapC/NirT family cytochrome c [Acidobacteriota bacterium]